MAKKPCKVCGSTSRQFIGTRTVCWKCGEVISDCRNERIEELQQALDEQSIGVAARVAAGDTEHLGGHYWAVGELTRELRELEGA